MKKLVFTGIALGAIALFYFNNQAPAEQSAPLTHSSPVVHPHTKPIIMVRSHINTMANKKPTAIPSVKKPNTSKAVLTNNNAATTEFALLKNKALH